jgi:hypothetical protein
MNPLSSSKMASLVAIAVISFLVAPAMGGPTTSGGGANFCYLPESGPVLLDLVQRRQAPPSLSVSFEQRVPGVKIQRSSRPFEPFDPFKGPFEGPSTGALKRRVQAIIHPFVTRYPELGYYLQESINNTWFVAIPQTFTAPVAADFTTQWSCDHKNSRAVIALNGGIKFVSRPAWNALDLDSQAHAIIHEGWRFAQQVIGMPISDQDLQDLTYFSIVDPEGMEGPGATRAYLWAVLGPKYSTSRLCEEKPDVYAYGLDELPNQVLRTAKLACKSPLLIDRSLYLSAANSVPVEDDDLTARPEPTTELGRARELKRISVRINRRLLKDYFNRMASALEYRSIVKTEVPSRLPITDSPVALEEFRRSPYSSRVNQFLSDLLADFPVGK